MSVHDEHRVHRLKLHLLLVPILFYTPNSNGAEWIGETSTCAGFIRRMRSHNIHSGDSSGGGEEQLNFLPFEMCVASERPGEGEGKTKPSGTLHTIWGVMQATRAVVTHSHVPPRISGIPDIIVGQSFTGKARLSFSEKMHALTKQHLLDYCEGGRERGSIGSIHVSLPMPTVSSFYYPTTPLALPPSTDRMTDRQYILPPRQRIIHEEGRCPRERR